MWNSPEHGVPNVRDSNTINMTETLGLFFLCPINSTNLSVCATYYGIHSASLKFLMYEAVYQGLRCIYKVEAVAVTIRCGNIAPRHSLIVGGSYFKAAETVDRRGATVLLSEQFWGGRMRTAYLLYKLWISFDERLLQILPQVRWGTAQWSSLRTIGGLAWHTLPLG